MSGIIVETEAYDQDEPASHSCMGPTKRNHVMFGPAGYIYVYRSYGVHWCFNVVTGVEGRGSAVLVRAVEPIEGEQLMSRLRRKAAGKDIGPRELARGPGRLCQALGITIDAYGHDATKTPLFFAKPPRTADALDVKQTPRIGIRKAVDLPWRFCAAGCDYVSGAKSLR